MPRSSVKSRTQLDEYECRHGQGYTVITSKLNGIKSSTRYFVPLGESLEIWQTTLINESGSDSDLSLFSAIEFCLWVANDDATNFQRNYSIGQMEIVDEVIYHKTEYRERRDHFAYFACSEKLAGFDTIREDFLGAYKGWNEPQVVARGKSCNTEAHGWQPIGSHHVKVHLKAGEQKKIIFVLGYHENPRDAKFDPPESQTINKRTVLPIISKYLKVDEVNKAFEGLRVHWDDARKLYLQPTTGCNLRCRTCIRNAWDEPEALMSMDTFNRLVESLDQLPHLNRVVFSGFGEPLTHPHILEMIGTVRKRNIAVTLGSNGLLLSAEMARELVRIWVWTDW